MAITFWVWDNTRRILFVGWQLTGIKPFGGRDKTRMIPGSNLEKDSPLLGHHLLLSRLFFLHLFILANHSHRWQEVQTLSRTSERHQKQNKEVLNKFQEPPPLEVVARSKAVAETSPWDSSSTIVARKASRPQEVGVGRVAAREG